MDYLSPQAVYQLKTHQLKLILALEEFGRISAAADALATTQPAASRTLADMERLLGVTLCERQPRGMRLTPIGESVARRARTVLSEMHSLSRDIEALKTGLSGTVHIGAVTSAAVNFAVPAIEQLKAEAPGVEVFLDVAPSDTLVRDLQSGYHDFILGRLPPGSDPGQFSVSAGRVEEVALVVRRDHPLTGCTNLDLSDIRDHDWVAQNRGSPIRDAVDSAFVRAGARTPERVTNTSSLLVSLAMLSKSTAIAPLARVVFELLSSESIGSRLCALHLRQPIVIDPYNVITVAGRHPTATATRLYRLVLEQIAQQDDRERSLPARL